MAHWTKKVDVFSQDLLLIPINHNNLHWCLAAVDMHRKIISYYDSMLGTGFSGESVVAHNQAAATYLLLDRAFKALHVTVDSQVLYCPGK